MAIEVVGLGPGLKIPSWLSELNMFVSLTYIQNFKNKYFDLCT
jgi:hypothetical protein